MQRIPEETIQQVLTATNIVDLIGRYVQLKKAGSVYKGLCPFHTEKTPSFNVSPTRGTGTYHCFGCGAGGSAIRFVMEHDGLTFLEAVKRLADMAGIRIEEQVWDANAEREAKARALLKKVHADVSAWYHTLLLRHEVAEDARQYLKGRGININIAKNWQLGYAPEHDSMIRRWAVANKYPDRVLAEAGIFSTSDEGRTYSRFRHRLMFPIRDENGDVIAFSGRALVPDARAKYLNSPETPLFSKSKVLFGFDKSKRAVSKQGRAIVCEGQLDMVTVYEAGVQNVVATQGTAFTEYHAKMLKRTCDEVVLCFDSDNAGFKAAERSFQILSPVGLTVKVASLPKGEDPDSLIRKHGAEAFTAAIDQAVDFLDFQISHKRATLGSDLRNQVQLIEQTAVTIAMNPSVAARDLMIRSHAHQLGVSEDALRKEVNSFVRRQQKGAQAKGPLTASEEAGKLVQSQHRTALLLCRMALSNVEVLKWLRSIDLEPVLRDLPGTELLGHLWHAQFEEGNEVALAAFFATLPADEERAFAQLLQQRMPGSKVEDATEAWNVLDLARLQHLVQQAQAKMNQPGLDPGEVSALHAQKMQWHKEYLDRSKPPPDTH